MVSSHEVRWFLEGSVEEHPALRRWVEEGSSDPKWIGRLGGKPDLYLIIPGSVDMGIKWREGQFQIKGLESSLGIQKFAGLHEGRVERWIKWSYEGRSIEDAFSAWFVATKGPHQIIEVHKRRCLRKVRMSPFATDPIELESNAEIDRGGALEVTDLRVNDDAYTSVAFEAFPNDSGMHGDFTVFVNSFLGKLTAVHLMEASSLSYPAWLQTLNHLPGKSE